MQCISFVPSLYVLVLHKSLQILSSYPLPSTEWCQQTFRMMDDIRPSALRGHKNSINLFGLGWGKAARIYILTQLVGDQYKISWPIKWKTLVCPHIEMISKWSSRSVMVSQQHPGTWYRASLHSPATLISFDTGWFGKHQSVHRVPAIDNMLLPIRHNSKWVLFKPFPEIHSCMVLIIP